MFHLEQVAARLEQIRLSDKQGIVKLTGTDGLAPAGDPAFAGQVRLERRPGVQTLKVLADDACQRDRSFRSDDSLACEKMPTVADLV